MIRPTYLFFLFQQCFIMDQSMCSAGKKCEDKFKQDAKRYDRGGKPAGFLVSGKTSMPKRLNWKPVLTNPTGKSISLQRRTTNNCAPHTLQSQPSEADWKSSRCG